MFSDIVLLAMSTELGLPRWAIVLVGIELLLYLWNVGKGIVQGYKKGVQKAYAKMQEEEM